MTAAAAGYRHAVYFAPPPASALGRLGGDWLGRHLDGSPPGPRPALDGISPERLAKLTAAPRRYGFHATLKAPFRPARPLAELEAALAALAGCLAPVPLKLAPAALGGFLALTATSPTDRLAQLEAAVCVLLDPYRAALTEAEVARRTPDRLGPAQRDHLARYGYPHVLSEFTFHMTLSGRLTPSDHDLLLPPLQDYWASALAEPVALAALALVVEPAPGADFRLLRYFPLSATG